MPAVRATSPATPRSVFTITDGGQQRARRVFHEAGYTARKMVRERGGYVTRALDQVASQQRGYKFSDHMAAIVLPMHDAGFTHDRIHHFCAQMVHDIVEALLTKVAA